MTYKMIVLDLDDTLLDDAHNITPYTKEMLLKAQKHGIRIVLASGRPTFGMLDLAKELNLDAFGSHILSFNGGKIIDCQTNEVMYQSTLTMEDVKDLYQASLVEGVFVQTYDDLNIITDKANPYTDIEADITGLPIRVVDDFLAAVAEEPVKLLMVDAPEKLIPVEKKLSQQFSDRFTVLRSKPYFLEFTEKGVTKGSSLSRLIDHLHIKAEEVIAIGDSYNDLAMIEFAGLGVAMGNAVEEVKERADFVTLSNTEDGVGHVINQFIFKSE